MLETVMRHGIIFYVLGIMMAAGVLAKVISYITARKLVKAAADIQKSNQRFMRLIKAKFEHASMVSEKVQNVEAFVKKYFYEYKVFGARLTSWRSFPVKMIWLIIMVGMIGMALSFQSAGLTEQTLRYGAFAAIYAVFLISIHILSDEKTKLEAAKNYMVEYLENVCIHRYEKANRVLHAAQEESAELAMEHATEGSTEVTIENMEESRVEKNVAESKEKEKTEVPFAEETEDTRQRDEQEMRFRAILEEFLA